MPEFLFYAHQHRHCQVCVFSCQHICSVANLLVQIHCSFMYTPINEPERFIDLPQFISYINISVYFKRGMVSSFWHTNVNLLKKWFQTDPFVFDSFASFLNRNQSCIKPFFNSFTTMYHVCCWSCRCISWLGIDHCEIFRYYRLRPFTNQSLMKSLKRKMVQ